MKRSYKEFNIVYMDGYYEVRDLDTQKVIFKTNVVDFEVSENVVDNVVLLWNASPGEHQFGPNGELDSYLLNAPCSQEARELIVEALFSHGTVELTN